MGEEKGEGGAEGLGREREREDNRGGGRREVEQKHLAWKNRKL